MRGGVRDNHGILLPTPGEFGWWLQIHCNPYNSRHVLISLPRVMLQRD